MTSTLGTAGATEGGQDSPDHDGVDSALVWRYVNDALVPAAGNVLGVVGRSRRSSSSNPGPRAGAGGPVGLVLACHDLDNSGKVVSRVGDGRPVSIGKGNNIICRSEKIIRSMQEPNDELGDLPQDVLHRIFSKLQINEVVRTSVLSSKWRTMWTISSKLSLGCNTLCGRPRYFCNKQKCTKGFIDRVNKVLQQLSGKVVEELEVKVEFNRSLLVDHLNNWISFAVSSLTKNLALDLAPAEFMGFKDRYMFPIELFDSSSISRIQHIQLSCVSFSPRSRFMGFPSLKRLDVHLFDVSTMDLDDMLSGCANLEWLSFIRCTMDDSLKAKHPLSRLLYLRILHCSITKVELRAENLKTFVYHGRQRPIDLGQLKQLETAEICILGLTIEHVLTVLPCVLLGVQNLTLQSAFLSLEKPLLLESNSSFSQLKLLRLFLLVSDIDSDNILTLASFLRAAPLIEELEVHFDVTLCEGWGTLRSLPRCSYNYLRKVHMTGFKGIKGQLEFLVHIVENAPVLEVLTVDPKKKLGLCERKDFSASRASVRSALDRIILPSTEVYIL